jgi:hypothetical protein
MTCYKNLFPIFVQNFRSRKCQANARMKGVSLRKKLQFPHFRHDREKVKHKVTSSLVTTVRLYGLARAAMLSVN